MKQSEIQLAINYRKIRNTRSVPRGRAREQIFSRKKKKNENETRQIYLFAHSSMRKHEIYST